MELNSLLMKFFCYVIWFDVEWHLRPCKRGLFVKSCFFKLIPKRFKNYKLNWTAVHRAFQNIVHSSIFRKKQTALHIAFQNIAHRSIFREKQAAMHTAFQNTVHRRFFRQKQTDARVAFQNIVQGRVFLEKQTAVHLIFSSVVTAISTATVHTDTAFLLHSLIS